MREKRNYSYVCSRQSSLNVITEQFLTAAYILLMVMLVSGCTKSSSYDPLIGDPLKAGISTVVPSNLEGSVFVDPVVTVIFKEGTNPDLITTASITLKKGDSTVPGSITFAETSASFSASTDLESESDYVATVTTKPQKNTDFGTMNEYSWRFRTGKNHRIDSLKVVSVTPSDEAAAVSLSNPVTVTFNQELSTFMKSSVLFLLKKGTTSISGTVTLSGKILTFQPAANLEAGAVYTGSIIIGTGHANDDKSGRTFIWRFTTAGNTADVMPPSVSSVVPANSFTLVSTTTKATVTFSEAMNPATISTTTLSIKQGSTPVAGSVAYSGTTATFTPSSALSPGTVYTGTVTTGVTDVAGNALAANYTWSFTTATIADVTPPTIVSVIPSINAVSVAVNGKVTATFSEGMDATTISALTFTLKQGSAAVAGSVTYSGATATFTPSGSLTGGTVYTATITIGAKDLSGNPLASSYIWSFTTAATVTGKSFATDVMLVLNTCNTCHTHGWTPSTTASTFYTNLLNSGYINPTTPTSGKIYIKLSGVHPSGSTVTAAQKAVVLAWITEGSKNN
jgi:hypothetical protein